MQPSQYSPGLTDKAKQMEKKYIVELSAEERQQLEGLIRKGKAAARKIQHAQILLKADQGERGPAWTDLQIAEAFGLGVRTVERVRERLVENGLEDALVRRQGRYGARRKLDGAAEAQLVKLACSKPPRGHTRWSIRLLAGKLVELEVVESVGRETVRQGLKKTKLSPG